MKLSGSEKARIFPLHIYLSSRDTKKGLDRVPSEHADKGCYFERQYHVCWFGKHEWQVRTVVFQETYTISMTFQ